MWDFWTSTTRRTEIIFLLFNIIWASLVAQKVKRLAWNAGDLGSIAGSGRSPEEGNGNPLQYSCLENPMDGGAWWATVHGVAEYLITADENGRHWGSGKQNKILPTLWTKKCSGKTETNQRPFQLRTKSASRHRMTWNPEQDTKPDLEGPGQSLIKVTGKLTPESSSTLMRGSSPVM